jgi:hypothetical protein
MKPHTSRINAHHYASLDTVQMSSAEREAAKRHLRVADSIATTLANGIALLTGFVTGRAGERKRAR